MLDPPWENASAVRGAKYGSLPARALLRLPLPALLDSVSVRAIAKVSCTLGCAILRCQILDRTSNACGGTCKLRARANFQSIKVVRAMIW